MESTYILLKSDKNASILIFLSNSNKEIILTYQKYDSFPFTEKYKTCMNNNIYCYNNEDCIIDMPIILHTEKNCIKNIIFLHDNIFIYVYILNLYARDYFDIFANYIRFIFHKKSISKINNKSIMYDNIDLYNIYDVRKNKNKIPSYLYKISYILSNKKLESGIYNYTFDKKIKCNYEDVIWNNFYDFDAETKSIYNFYDDISISFNKKIMKNKKYDIKIYFRKWYCVK